MKPAKPGTVQEKVLTYLKTGHSIDAPKVQALFGYHQLPVAVHHLRKKGHDIRKEMVKSRDGNSFAVYRLVPPFALGEKVRHRLGKKAKVMTPETNHGMVGVRFSGQTLTSFVPREELERAHA